MSHAPNPDYVSAPYQSSGAGFDSKGGYQIRVTETDSSFRGVGPKEYDVEEYREAGGKVVLAKRYKTRTPIFQPKP